MTEHLNREELKAVMREAVREELAHAGLLLEDEKHVFAAREDFRFVRRLRTAIDGAATTVGKIVLTAVITGVLGAFWLGFKLLTK